MNLSLVIAIVLTVVIIPWLLWKLFPRGETLKSTEWLTPELQPESEGQVQVMQKVANDPLQLSDLQTTTTVSEKNKSYSKQKDLLSDNQFRIIRVLAPKEYFFTGYDLLQALQNANLIYGEWQIFHYYNDNKYNDNKSMKAPLFSVASAVEPGAFNLQEIGAYMTPGLTLFMNTACNDDITTGYQKMLKTAEQLAEDLGGKVICEDD